MTGHSLDAYDHGHGVCVQQTAGMDVGGRQILAVGRQRARTAFMG